MSSTRFSGSPLLLLLLLLQSVDYYPSKRRHLFTAFVLALVQALVLALYRIHDLVLARSKITGGMRKVRGPSRPIQN
jgi:hypothetical protein